MESNPVVVVTGASAGVGRAVALAFAARGARLALIARDAEALEQVRAAVERLGSTGLAVPLDLADHGAVSEATDRIERELGSIDIWVNAAMVTVFSEVRKLSPEELRRVTEVTYLGNAYGLMEAYKRMVTRDRGTIVQVGSALAYRSIPLQAAYCGAKAGLRGFVDSLRTELIHAGSAVRITMVHLPAVNTPQFDWARSHMPRRPRPVAPIYQPEDIAREIVAAADRPSREVWIGNSTRMAILGTFAAPDFADWYVAKLAFSGQQTDEPDDPGRPDNLFQPVKGLHRMRGRFSDESKPAPVPLSGRATRGLAAAAAFTVMAGIVLMAGAGARAGRR